MKPSRPSRWIRWLKRLAFVAVALITLVALTLAIEGYRAKSAWLACEQELESQGEKLYWTDLALPSVPNDQNFLATPVLAACFGFEPTAHEGGTDGTNTCDQLIENLSWAGHVPGPGDWRDGTVIGLDQWQSKLREAADGTTLKLIPGEVIARLSYAPTDPPPDPQPPVHGSEGVPAWAALRARPAGTPLEDLRFLLDHDRAVLDEIRAASRRPFARIDLRIGSSPEVLLEGLMPQFPRLKGLVRPFSVSCSTELVADNPEAALADFETMLALGEAAGSQPLLIGMLVKIAMAEIAIRPLWSGLAEHRWPDTELVELERHLSRINLVADMQHCLRGERAFSLAHLLPASAGTDDGATIEGGTMQNAMRFWPSAVIYRNRINLARAYQSVLIARLNPSAPSVRLTATAEDRALRKRFGTFSPYNVFTPQLLPAIEKSLETAAKSQATVTLARVACALERFYLAKGVYPDAIDELTPRFVAQLPPDPVNGGALHYRREAPDRFVLYSVGLNGLDDGGEAAPRKPSGSQQAYEGDIVWRSLPSVQQSAESEPAN